jgi:hypothetical protein
LLVELFYLQKNQFFFQTFGYFYQKFIFMKNLKIVLLIAGSIVFMLLIYWHGEKGRYQERDGYILDTKTGNLFAIDLEGKKTSLNSNIKEEDTNKKSIIYSMTVWPFLSWKSTSE